MDSTLILVLLGAALLGATYWVTIKLVDKGDAADESDVGNNDTTPTPPANTVKAAAVQQPVKALPRLPTQAKLESFTKVQLEQFARDTYNVELDRRKTKVNMIQDLRNEVAALRTTQILQH